MATLWDRFQKAVRWLDTAQTALAGIVSLPGAEPSDPAEIVGATSGTTVAPTTVADGIDVQGFQTVDLKFVFTTAAETSTLRIYLWDGTDWLSPEADKSIALQATETKLYIEPIDVESFDRIDVRIITTPTAGTLAISGSPNNE